MNRRETVLALAAPGAFPVASVGQQARAYRIGVIHHGGIYVSVTTSATRPTKNATKDTRIVFYAGAAEFQRASGRSDVEAASSSSWMEMKTDTVYGPQWTHPHPSWSFDERFVAFTSDRSGSPQVHVAEVPEGLREGLARGERSDPM